jgi:hypothetical protein
LGWAARKVEWGSVGTLAREHQSREDLPNHPGIVARAPSFCRARKPDATFLCVRQTPAARRGDADVVSPQATLVDRIFLRVKNNPIAAFVIVAATMVIALSTFTDATKKLVALVEKDGRPPVVNVTGKWTTPVLTNPFSGSDTFTLSFDFEVKGDTLLGEVRTTGTTYRYDVRSGIFDGKIEGNVISFHTRQVALSGKERIPYKISYRGSVSKDEIDFTFQSDFQEGSPPQKVAARRQRPGS